MKTVKTAKSFSFLETKHSGPLSPQGRENWDRIFNKGKEPEKETKPQER